MSMHSYLSKEVNRGSLKQCIIGESRHENSHFFELHFLHFTLVLGNFSKISKTEVSSDQF
jgi:hypothetical protein